MNILDSPFEGSSYFWHQQQRSQHKLLQNPFFWRFVWNLLLHYKCYSRVHPAESSESHTLRFFLYKIEIKRDGWSHNTWPTCGSPSESRWGQADFPTLLFLNILEDRSDFLRCSSKSILSVCQNSHKENLLSEFCNRKHCHYI